jgi:hypothetical protein
MSDEHQIVIPPSFLALYTDARRRLTEPVDTVRSRYELCEDLSNQLVDHAKALHFDNGISEDEVIARCRAGLSVPESGLSAPEGEWVVTRLAELLGWLQCMPAAARQATP